MRREACEHNVDMHRMMSKTHKIVSTIIMMAKFHPTIIQDAEESLSNLHTALEELRQNLDAISCTSAIVDSLPSGKKDKQVFLIFFVFSFLGSIIIIILIQHAHCTYAVYKQEGSHSS